MPIVKTRKDYICDICGVVISKGEKALYWEMRAPKYSGDYFSEEQIGIEYFKGWHHIEGDQRCKFEGRIEAMVSRILTCVN